jgi:hypothetical protein
MIKKEMFENMTTLTISKKLLNSISLPGMGKSVELTNISGGENLEIRQVFSQGSLQIEFSEEPGVYHSVINVWTDPHSMSRITLFIN